jgi:hypothetical protein
MKAAGRPLTAALFTLFLASVLLSEVRLCGVQEEDLNLKPENNPYVISGDVFIKARTLWNINPGVVFKIALSPACSLPPGLVTIENKERLVAIYVKGSFQCLGSSDKRVIFEPLEPKASGVSWYGIVFDNAKKDYVKLCYADISGAMVGIQISNCSPLIRNCLIEGNQTGIRCGILCKSKIYNNNILNNFSTGILCKSATPNILNNIIEGNLTGIWSDQVSDLEIDHNAFWDNRDADFMECPPKYGIISKVNKNGDSCDFKDNIFINPVFFGSRAHADSVESDIRVSTDTVKADVADRRLARKIVETMPDSIKRAAALNAPHKKWQLSGYSRLINAGNPKASYKDADGSINDIGMYGASEFKLE